MTSTGLQVLRVAGGVAAALSAESLRALEPATLKSFLAGRRWFGAKGQELHSAQIFDVIPFPWREPPAAITRVEVDLGDGRLESYQLPVALWRGDPDAADAPGAVLARVESGGATSGRECGVLFDALEDATFRTRLREALAAGAAFEGSGARWSVELTGAVGTGLETDGETRLMASEQSNTSIVFAERSIFKLFRRLEHGEHPEAEIARFLSTRTQFRNTPELLGVVRFRDAGDHESTAGMLQRFVPNAADAWSHALARACDYLDRWDSTEPPNLFVDDAAELGRVTRGLHEALASDRSDPEFAPHPAGPNDVALWAAVARRGVERALALLESRGRWADGQMGSGADGWRGGDGEARALVERREEALSRIRAIVTALGDDTGARIRHHGDYHLGQVLRTPPGEFFIIDFEGEPARPLAERRERHSALRDVAGMLRSFAYAGAVSAMETDRRPHRPIVEERAALWERDARHAFLNGYLAEKEGGAFLPRAREDVTRLLELFEIEKVFYELAYELNNRPGWAWVPMRGIARLLDTPLGAV